jgi:endonuclease G
MLKNFFFKQIFVLFGVISLVSCKKEDLFSQQQDTTTHSHTQEEINTMSRLATENLTMGNPSNAITSTTSPTNYLLTKTTWSASYNRDRGIPNWVSWHLDNTWLGSATRCDCFASDITLPTGWYRVSTSSYSGSGFDRGHMCPSADRTYSSADNRETFLMTNMIPQAPNNNQRTWVGLENYERTLVNQGNECFIICGSYGIGGTGSSGTKNTLDAGRVTVPKQIWKVLIAIPQGTNDVSRVTTSSHIIAINTPNINTLNTNWGVYRTSVDAIESAMSATFPGFDLFSNLPDDIEAVLEAKIDNGPTQ